MASQLHYLTVQDILWINLQVTEKVHTFSFAKLEEATYYQYAYGDSKNVVPQAARFIIGFPKMRPLDAGNDATAFLALLTFLQINGMDVDLKDNQAAGWYRSIQSKEAEAQAAIGSIAKHAAHTHGPADIRKTVRDLIAGFPGTLLALTGE